MQSNACANHSPDNYTTAAVRANVHFFQILNRFQITSRILPGAITHPHLEVGPYLVAYSEYIY
jgi:hypothetical protein